MIKNILAFVGGAFLLHKGFETYCEQQKHKEPKQAEKEFPHGKASQETNHENRAG